MQSHDSDSGIIRWSIGYGESIVLDRPVLMGVLNVTPDSFSDGGIDAKTSDTIARGLAMVEAGAAILDVGGESTRPGALRVSGEDQINRIVPVIKGLKNHCDAVISIDTTLCSVARAALEAGAAIINDVSAGSEDEGMFALAAEWECGLVLMHRLRPPDEDSYSDQYETQPGYVDVMSTVKAFLQDRLDGARRAGVQRDALVIDPGLGFGKSVEQNFEIIARMSELVGMGYPVLAAASRKSFIGAATGIGVPSDRVSGSVAAAMAMYRAGVRVFRVHDVSAHRQALDVAEAIENAG